MCFVKVIRNPNIAAASKFPGKLTCLYWQLGRFELFILSIKFCALRRKKKEFESSAFPVGSGLNSLSKAARESLINFAKVSSGKMGLGCLGSDYCLEQMGAVIHIRL